jgi:hypothetical protein
VTPLLLRKPLKILQKKLFSGKIDCPLPSLPLSTPLSTLVKPVAEYKGWKRIRSMEYLGYGRGYVLVRG